MLASSFHQARIWRLSQLFCFILALSCAGIQATYAAEPGAFPVKIRHALGEVSIETEPRRIVALGWSGADPVIALGQVPVGMTRRAFFASGIPPWLEERLGGTKPVLLENDTDYEAIAALRPDLILGIYSGIDELAYKRLSGIAPTIVYRSGPWVATWEEQTEMTGLALGQPRRATELEKQTEDTIARLRRQYSVLEGKTFAYGTYIQSRGAISVYLPEDPRYGLLAKLGLVGAPEIERLAKENPGRPSAAFALENIGQIEADVLLMWYRDDARASLEAQPLFKALKPVAAGAYVALDDPVSIWSASALSVLSIPYGLPAIAEKLAAAASH